MTTKIEQTHRCSVCGRNDVRLYRWYGHFLRDEDITCKAHTKPGLIEKQVVVPLVEDVDGTVWGYTSAPQDAIDRFNSLIENDEKGDDDDSN